MLGLRSTVSREVLRASQAQQWRCISEEQLNASPEHLQDLFRRNLDKASRKRPEGGQVVRTTRREALALYREILRYSNLFVWKDHQGRTWRDLIRHSTRKEYEDAKHEQDPEIVNKLIITGRDAMHRTVESFMAKRAHIIREEVAAHDANQPQR
ncbi:hypothetical protein V8C86DRAFT_2776594 [Haematococcus lacustris]